MNLPNPESASIKVEPGSQEEGGSEMRYTDIDIDIQDIKKECLQYSETTPIDRKLHCKSNIILETVPMKAEPGPRDLPYTEIDIDLPDVKKECLERSKRITLIADLLTNPKTHPGVKRFSCPLCNYSYQGKSSLELHTRRHSGEKPFICSACSYSFSQKGVLKRHMLTHSGEKPFTCFACSYSCSRKDGITSHLQTHSAEKPFTCSVCSYSCSLKGNLKRHLLTQAGEKSFACSVCSYSCSQKIYLKKHMLTKKHGG